MNSNEREKPEQMPGTQDPAETASVVSEQGGIPGQRKEVNVESYEGVASIGQALKNFDFPANKNKILDFVKTNTTAKDVLEKLEKLPDKEYKNLSEVTYESGLVY